MATFPYAFPKLMLATGGIVETANKKTLELTPGQLGVINAATNKTVAIGAGTTYQTTPLVYLAQGSLSANDNLGGRSTLGVGSASRTPFHGGYKESIKSRSIDPRYISRFYYVGPADQTYASIKVTVIGDQLAFNDNQSLNGGPHQPAPDQDGSLRTQEVYRLRLDAKGSPALRLLNRNMYYFFDASTKCMANGSIDRHDLLVQWMEQINAHPIMSLLVRATIPAAGAAGTADDLSLLIEDVVRPTEFADPTYSRNDFHEREGLQLFASVLDERNVQCNGQLFKTEDVTVSRQGSGFGETLLSEMILEDEYQLKPFHSDSRLREVLEETSLRAIDRTKKYGAYFLLYSVPRKWNSNSTLDNDQILIKIVTAGVNPVGTAGTRNQAFEDFIVNFAASAGNNIDFENLTGVVGQP